MVFSQWPEILELLETACFENSLRSVLAVGKFHDAVSRFLHGPVTVLLLPLSKGGQGLNLTAATHVVLVEPVMDPRVALQAAGRIHRMGQTKPTTVHTVLKGKKYLEKLWSLTCCAFLLAVCGSRHGGAKHCRAR